VDEALARNLKWRKQGPLMLSLGLNQCADLRAFGDDLKTIGGFRLAVKLVL
jgi:hypothetical protein